MRIYYSTGQDPMALDSLAGMNQTHRIFMAFLDSDRESIRLDADVTGDGKPYNELLKGLLVRKCTGPIQVLLTTEQYLDICGAPDNLGIYLGHFLFQADEEGNHHHPGNVMKEDYMSNESLGLIIEVDSDYIGELSANNALKPTQ
jgi:hypothetical protein